MIYYGNKEFIKIARPLPNYVKRDIYDIPFIEKDDIDISDINNGKWLIKPNNMSQKDKFANRKIVHSFCYDRDLYRYYNDPVKFLHKAAAYYAVTSFDFSISAEWRFHEVYNATYNNRWIGAYAQSLGKRVIPTVGWTTPQFYDITFAGLRNGSVFLISTLSVNNSISSPLFLQGYKELRRRFPDSPILAVGDEILGMDSDVCFIKYKDSFGSEDIRSGYWQPKLFNWDMSIAKEVI